MSAVNIGSVFLGDRRNRLLSSSSTPPASPSPPAMAGSFSAVQPLQSAEAASAIEPAMSLELRLRWLEAILWGVRQDARDRKGKDKELKNGETLLRASEDLQRRLNGVMRNNDGLKRFVDHCPSSFPPFIWPLLDLIDLTGSSRRP